MSAATSSRSSAIWSRSRIALVKERKRKDVEAKAELAAEERVLDALVGATASAADPRRRFRRKLRAGELDDKEIEIELAAERRRHADVRTARTCPAPRSARSIIGDMFGKGFGGRTKPKRMTVAKRDEPLIAEESRQAARPGPGRAARRSPRSRATASSSSTRSTRSAPARDRGGADVSREGVQRDLLPLIEGTTVSTKHGPVKTDHILFIASGAFHVAKPSDLLPELQGRLPIRVELKSLTEDDFRRILTETEASLIKQYVRADEAPRA